MSRNVTPQLTENRFPAGDIRPPGPGDAFERRARLICLVYEVLRSVETPADGATDMAMLSALARALSDKTSALTNLEADAPGREHGKRQRREATSKEDPTA
jgi:hypothetical protein